MYCHASYKYKYLQTATIAKFSVDMLHSTHCATLLHHMFIPTVFLTSPQYFSISRYQTSTPHKLFLSFLWISRPGPILFLIFLLYFTVIFIPRSVHSHSYWCYIEFILWWTSRDALYSEWVMKVVRKVTKHKTDIIKIRMEHQNFGLLIGIGGSFSSEAAPTVFPNPATHQPSHSLMLINHLHRWIRR